MLAIERRSEILRLLQSNQSVLVSELAKQYGVTEETIRRDLERLEQEGFAKKTYGGAVLKDSLNTDIPLRVREKTNIVEKRSIAKLAASIIEDGDSIMIDSSSTSLFIAKELKSHKKLTVITNSMEVLIELSDAKDISVISTGGTFRQANFSLVGKNTERMLSEFNVDKTIVSCKSLHIEKAVTESSVAEMEIKKVMLSRAKKIILAADSTKFDSVSFVKLMDLGEIDMLLTDTPPKPEWASTLQKLDVEVLCSRK